MNKPLLIASVLVLALTLGACTHLPDQTSTEQVTNKTWAVNGNTYTTSIEYEIPEGTETNTFTLVIENNLIKSVTVGITETVNKTSLLYQQDFADNIAAVIVSKDITTLPEIDRISGASLTTQAFNDAIKKLQAEL